jgi:hypothetical protein
MDTSIESVRDLVGSPNVEVIAGYLRTVFRMHRQ